MKSKEVGKKIRRDCGRVAFKILSLIIKFIPQRLLYALADSVAWIGYCIAGRHRKIALHGLNIALGKEKTKGQIERIAKDSFRNIARSSVELLYILENPSKIEGKVHIEGKKHLDDALSEGKGVIMISAHFGNFALMLVGLAHVGYKINTIIRRMRDQKIDEYLCNKRGIVRVNTIYSTPRKKCVDDSLRVLRNKEVLYVQMDQNFGTGGIFVDFFGMKAATATGPAVFALRTGAPILPAFIIRNKDNTSRIVIEPALHLEKESSEEGIQNTIQKITNIIERYIRRYPQEWGWIHRRWKSRPSN